MTVPNETKRALAKAVLSIMRTNGEAWAGFMTVLKQRADALATDLVMAKVDDLMRLQGRAKEAREFVKELEEAPALAEEIINQERTNAKAAG